MTPIILYIAHKFSGDPANLDKAERWAPWLSLHFEGVVAIVPWVPLCRHWPDSGATRERGLALDMIAVDRTDGLVAFGLEVSTGMNQELARAQRWIDLTGYATPEDLERDAETMARLRDWIEAVRVAVHGRVLDRSGNGRHLALMKGDT